MSGLLGFSGEANPILGLPKAYPHPELRVYASLSGSLPQARRRFFKTGSSAASAAGACSAAGASEEEANSPAMRRSNDAKCKRNSPTRDSKTKIRRSSDSRDKRRGSNQTAARDMPTKLGAEGGWIDGGAAVRGLEPTWLRAPGVNGTPLASKTAGTQRPLRSSRYAMGSSNKREERWLGAQMATDDSDG